MRNLILAAALMLGTFANATSIIHPDTTSKFDYINIGDNWNIKNFVVGGDVTMGYLDGTLTVTLKVSNCPAGAMCLVPIEIREVSYVADIYDSEKDGCGSLIVKAKRDERPVDGTLVEIELADHQNRVCDDFVRNLTDVKLKQKFYDRLSGKEVTLKANFGGGVLQ